MTNAIQPQPPIAKVQGTIRTPATAAATPEAHTPEGDVLAELPLDHDATAQTTTPSSVSLPHSSEPTSSEPSAAAQGRSFHTIGDPHERSGDGLNFDNMLEGEFIKARAKDGSFELQTRHDRAGAVTFNGAAAAKLGDDVVTYDVKTKALTVNGEVKQVAPGDSLDLPGGGKVKFWGSTIDLESPKGDKVRILDNGHYLDISGEISESRQDGEVAGSLGTFDADTDASNDLVGRDGKVHQVDPTDQKAVDAFLEEWRPQGEESLFQAGAGAKPVDGEEPVGGEGPVDPAEPTDEEATDVGDRLGELVDLVEDLGPEGLEHLVRLVELLSDDAPAAEPTAEVEPVEAEAPVAGEAPAPAEAEAPEANDPQAPQDGLGQLGELLDRLGPNGWKQLVSLLELLRKIGDTEEAA